MLKLVQEFVISRQWESCRSLQNMSGSGLLDVADTLMQVSAVLKKLVQLQMRITDVN